MPRGSAASRGRPEPRHQVVGEGPADLLGAGRAARVEPAWDPVDGAQDREGQQLRVSGGEGSLGHALAQEAPHAAVHRVALGHDAAQQPRRQGREVQGQRRAVQLVDDHVHELLDQAPQPPLGAAALLRHAPQQAEQYVQGVVVAEEQHLLLVPEVVVEVALGHAQGARDLPGGGAVVAAAPEGRGGAAQDLDAPRVAARAGGHAERHATTASGG
jgi:hypothetical protein